MSDLTSLGSRFCAPLWLTISGSRSVSGTAASRGARRRERWDELSLRITLRPLGPIVIRTSPAAATAGQRPRSVQATARKAVLVTTVPSVEMLLQGDYLQS